MMRQFQTMSRGSEAVDFNLIQGNSSFVQGWKFMSCRHCQELCQQASWLLLGCTRVNNQLEARIVTWPDSWQWLQLIYFRTSLAHCVCRLHDPLLSGRKLLRPIFVDFFIMSILLFSFVKIVHCWSKYLLWEIKFNQIYWYWGPKNSVYCKKNCLFYF